MENKTLRYIAQRENIPQKELDRNLHEGTLVILKNRLHTIAPIAIGKGATIKINTNLGASTNKASLIYESQKLDAAIRAHADTVMDLTVGKSIRRVRKIIMKKSPIPVGTVPIYEAAQEAKEKKGSFEKMNFDDFMRIFIQQAQEGVDFFTIHSGITKKIIEYLQKNPRKTSIVSRGGALIARWILSNNKENLLYENFPAIVSVAKKYNIALSLGDGMRPGSLADSLDYAQLQELFNLGELAAYAHSQGVQVIIEGPGHVPFDQIATQIKLEKTICKNAPFYVLGPLVIDRAAGFDHIASAIGSAQAAFYGADFLCVVTPKEHLAQPGPKDIYTGTVASKIAAHAINVIRKKELMNQEALLSRARKERDWEQQVSLSLFPEEARKHSKNKEKLDTCSMCGQYCAFKLLEKNEV